MKKLTKTRKILLALAALLLAVGGAVAWLFLNPAEPAIVAESGLSCESITQCSRECALECPSGIRKLPCMNGCTGRCAEKGCGKSAKDPYAALTTCVRNHCLMDCISGPGPDCDACADAECAGERDVCMAQEC